MDKQTEISRNTVINILKELMIRSDKFNVSPANFKVLLKAFYTLKCFPVKRITGYIDVSANTHLPGGGLDYSSFSIGEDYFEIYNGFVSYKNAECDDSSWEKIFSTKDTEHRPSLYKSLEAWAASFLLHLEDEPKRSLLIIDRSKLE